MVLGADGGRLRVLPGPRLLYGLGKRQHCEPVDSPGSTAVCPPAQTPKPALLGSKSNFFSAKMGWFPTPLPSIVRLCLAPGQATASLPPLVPLSFRTVVATLAPAQLGISRGPVSAKVADNDGVLAVPLVWTIVPLLDACVLTAWTGICFPARQGFEVGVVPPPRSCAL